eukprot:3303974-Amphidinium_carterae.1
MRYATSHVGSPSWQPQFCAFVRVQLLHVPFHGYPALPLAAQVHSLGVEEQQNHFTNFTHQYIKTDHSRHNQALDQALHQSNRHQSRP